MGATGRMAAQHEVLERRLRAFSNAALLTGGAMTMLGVNMVRTAASYELMRSQLLAVARSHEKANRLWAEGVELAKQTALEIRDIVPIYTTVTRLAERAGIEPTRAVKAIADAAGVMGRSGEELQQFAIGLSRGFAGTGAASRMVREWTRGLIDLTELKKVAAREGRDIAWVFLEELERQFKGGQERMRKTVIGGWSTLMDALHIAMAQAAEPAMGPLKRALEGAITWMEGLSKGTKSLIAWTIALGGPLIFIAGLIGKLVLVWRTLTIQKALETAATKASIAAEEGKAVAATAEAAAVGRAAAAHVAHGAAAGASIGVLGRLRGVLAGIGGALATLSRFAGPAAIGAGTAYGLYNILYPRIVGGRPRAPWNALKPEPIEITTPGAVTVEEGRRRAFARAAGMGAAPAKLEAFQQRELAIGFLEDKRARAERLNDLAKMARVETELIALYRRMAEESRKYGERNQANAKILLEAKQAEAGWLSKISNLQIDRTLREAEAAQKSAEKAKEARDAWVQAGEDAAAAWLTFADVLEGRGNIAAAERARRTAAVGFLAVAGQRRGEPGAYWGAIGRAEDITRGIGAAAEKRAADAAEARVKAFRTALATVGDESRMAWLELARNAAERRENATALLAAEKAIRDELQRQLGTLTGLAKTWGWLPEIATQYAQTLDRVDAITVSLARSTKQVAQEMAGIGDMIDLYRQAAELFGGQWQERYTGALRARITQLGATPWTTGAGGMPTAETMTRAQEYLARQGELKQALEKLNKTVEQQPNLAREQAEAMRAAAGGQWAGMIGGGRGDRMRELMARAIGIPSDFDRTMAGILAGERGQLGGTTIVIVIDGKEAMRREIGRYDRSARLGVRLDGLRY